MANSKNKEKGEKDKAPEGQQINEERRGKWPKIVLVIFVFSSLIDSGFVNYAIMKVWQVWR